MERTLCLIKPDAVQRGLMGAVVSRVERKGLQIVGLRMLKASRELAAIHYAEHQGKAFYPKLIDYITSGPIVALCVQGHRAVSVLRAIVGKTDPAEAVSGTIRGDFGMCKGRNVIHASDSVDAAKREIELYFGQDELIDFDWTIYEWVYRED
ncbi:MAG: Nucleoside diphosphate kinase [Firmicutes bacterium]|nr:Nucleoside diphosphate kinase [Bacillota bacterium]